MAQYVDFPKKVYLVREKNSGRYRKGVGNSRTPKLYLRSPGLKPGEQLVEMMFNVRQEVQINKDSSETLVIL
jgi:hypothetical protein